MCVCVCVCVCVERGGHFKFCTLRRYLGNKLMAEFIFHLEIWKICVMQQVSVKCSLF